VVIVLAQMLWHPVLVDVFVDGYRSRQYRHIISLGPRDLGESRSIYARESSQAIVSIIQLCMGYLIVELTPNLQAQKNRST
jgi:hypothetical protein